VTTWDKRGTTWDNGVIGCSFLYAHKTATMTQCLMLVPQLSMVTQIPPLYTPND